MPMRMPMPMLTMMPWADHARHDHGQYGRGKSRGRGGGRAHESGHESGRGSGHGTCRGIDRGNGRGNGRGDGGRGWETWNGHESGRGGVLASRHGHGSVYKHKKVV